MIPLLLLLPLLFLLAVLGQDSEKGEPRVVVDAIDGLLWHELHEGAKRDSLMPFLWKMGTERGYMIGQQQPKVEDGGFQRHPGALRLWKKNINFH